MGSSQLDRGFPVPTTIVGQKDLTLTGVPIQWGSTSGPASRFPMDANVTNYASPVNVLLNTYKNTTTNQ